MKKGTIFLIIFLFLIIEIIGFAGILGDTPIAAKFLFGGLAFGGCIAMIIFLWPPKKAYVNTQKVAPPPAVTFSPHVRTCDSYQFKVAGVTFKNGRKSRQTILRAIYFGDEPYDDELVLYHLKKYEFEGELAVAVYAKNEQIGNVPRADLPFILEHFDDIVDVDVDVYGGGTNENREKLSYGAKATIIYKI